MRLVPEFPPLNAYAYDDNVYKVVDEIQGLISELSRMGKRIVIIFYKLSEYTASKDVYSNIAALRDYGYGSVTFAFVDNSQLFRVLDGTKKYGPLYDQIMNTVMWLKMPSKKDFIVELKYWGEQYHFDFPIELQDFIWQQTSGHPALVKHMLAYFFENSDADFAVSANTEHFILNTNLEQILASLDDKEVDALRQIAKSGKHSLASTSDMATALINYDLIEHDADGLKIKIGLLEDFLLREGNRFETIQSRLKLPESAEDYSFTLQIRHGEVYMNGVKTDQDFTEREYHVIEYLNSRRGEICTRDEIANIIWKDDASDKFSDWGLDQTMSRIRKKLKDNGYQPQFIKTLRGRGFRLEK